MVPESSCVIPGNEDNGVVVEIRIAENSIQHGLRIGDARGHRTIRRVLIRPRILLPGLNETDSREGGRVVVYATASARALIVQRTSNGVIVAAPACSSSSITKKLVFSSTGCICAV